jgi:hypothetical protein
MTELSNFVHHYWIRLLGFYEENNETNLSRLVREYVFLEKV